MQLCWISLWNYSVATWTIFWLYSSHWSCWHVYICHFVKNCHAETQTTTCETTAIAYGTCKWQFNHTPFCFCQTWWSETGTETALWWALQSFETFWQTFYTRNFWPPQGCITRQTYFDNTANPDTLPTIFLSHRQQHTLLTHHQTPHLDNM